MPAQPAGLIFDIDSTLYKNTAYQREQVDVQIRHFARTRGLPFDQALAMVEDARRRYAMQQRASASGNEGKMQKSSLGNALTLLGVPVAESVRWRIELTHPEDFLQPDPELRQALERLAARYPFCVLTNNPVEIGRRTLETLGVSDLFPRLIGLDTFFLSKPDRRLFLAAAEECGVPPERAVSVGDRFDVDIAVPLDLGMGGVLVNGVCGVYRLPDVLL